MAENRICDTCKAYKRYANDWGEEHNAGECGSGKVKSVFDKGRVDRLTDELVAYGAGLTRIKVAPSFGCIHWR